MAGAIFCAVFVFGFAKNCRADAVSADSVTPTATASAVPAQPWPIFINEVMWQGSSVSATDQWIELYNDSDEAADISGYSLCAPSETDLSACSWSVPIDDGQIAGKSFFLISNYGVGDKSILSVVPDVEKNDISLSNSKLKIELRDEAEKVIDTAGDGSSSFLASFKKPFPESFYSLQRINYQKTSGEISASWRLSDDSINFKTNFDNRVTDYGTPKASVANKISNLTISNKSYQLNTAKQMSFSYGVSDMDQNSLQIAVNGNAGADVFSATPINNQFDLPASSNCWILDFDFYNSDGFDEHLPVDLNCYSTNNQVVFSEVLSSPHNTDWDGDGVANSHDEWFELQNISLADYTLTGWNLSVISTTSGTQKSAKLSGLIPSGGFLVFSYKDTKISLNNSGETLYLYDPGGKLIDQIKIPALDYNISYSKFDDGWKLTQSVTPLAENIFLWKQDPKAEVAKPIIKLAVAESLPIEVIAETPIAEETIVVTEYTTKILSPPLQLPDIELASISLPEVKGSKTKSAFYPSNLCRLLLYSFSILIFFSLIFLYEFYRRE